MTAGAPLGARVRADGSCSFCVWSPAAERLSVRLYGEPVRTIELQRAADGYHSAVVPGVASGARYTFVAADGAELPDPASRYQPDGVHAPSEVVDHEFDWRMDTWPAPDLRTLVIYELHVGTFTPEGTFDAVIPRLDELRDLGITAIEIMPIAQFPGDRNWGYDGVYAFAAQASYGGPVALKRLVDAAHARGIAVVLDVVYNHVGPEGNYLSSFGPYFTDVYHTPWGRGMNFDGADSDHVRRYFTDSALQWIDEFRIDALRLDAVHAIHDRSATPFLRELAAAVRERARQRGRTAILIAESDLGDPRVVRTPRLGGLGMDAQWLDDFHHSLRTLLTGEQNGYYEDFGTLDHLARAFREGYVYSGQYSRYRRRRHGAPGRDILPRQFVVFAHNHDQVGNRLAADRLSTSVPADRLRLAAASVLLSPFTPLLFMGEEYGERRPFPYFVSHSEEQLIEAVRQGRRAEFAAFAWHGEPLDPQAEETFASARLDWDARTREPHLRMLQLHRKLLRLRADEPSIRAAQLLETEILDGTGQPIAGDTPVGVLLVRRRAPTQTSLLLLNFSPSFADVPVTGRTAWKCALDTAAADWGADGNAGPIISDRAQLAPYDAMLLLRDEEA